MNTTTRARVLHVSGRTFITSKAVEVGGTTYVVDPLGRRVPVAEILSYEVLAPSGGKA